MYKKKPVTDCKVSAIRARLLDIIQTKATIVNIIGCLNGIRVEGDAEWTHVTGDGAIDRTDFRIEGAATNLILARCQWRLAISYFRTGYQYPIVCTGIGSTLGAATDHWANRSIGISRECEGACTIVAWKRGYNYSRVFVILSYQKGWDWISLAPEYYLYSDTLCTGCCRNCARFSCIYCNPGWKVVVQWWYRSWNS